MSKGGGSPASQTTTVQIPPEFQNVIFGGNQGIIPQAQQLANTGSLVPTFTPGDTTLAGRESQLALADTLGGQFLPQVTDIFGSFGDQAGGLADIATANLRQELERNVLPTIGQAAINAGQFGSSRQGIAEGLARAEAERNIADTRARILFEGAQRQTQFAPVLAQLLGLPTQLIQGVGQAEDVEAQAARESEAANLTALAQLVQGFIPGASQTTVGESSRPSVLARTAGGALAGAGLSNALNIAGPWGTLAGAALGLLSS